MNLIQRRQQLEQLLNELLSGIQEVLQSGEMLPDELQGMIAQEIGQLTEEIDQINSQIDQEGNTQSAPIEGPPSPASQLMWILAGQKEDIFLDYLRTYPDPELQSLLNNPAALEHTIVQLHEMMPSGRPEMSEDGIPHAEVNSSNVYGYDYDVKSKTLRVKFQGNEGSGEGPVYEYDNVPANVYKSFENMSRQATTNGQNRWGRWWVGKPSLGASFYQLIRNGGYNYRRIT